MDRPRVSAIIVNYNLKDDTIACIESLQHTSYPALDIIVVDNASIDDSVDAIRSRYPDVFLIESSENLSYPGGNNLGIEEALKREADYLLILNNDVVVDPGFVDALVQEAGTDPKIGMVCPKVYYFFQKDVIWSAGARIDMRWGRPALIGCNEPDQGQYDVPGPLDFIDGCAFLVTRQVCEQVGLIDPIYFAYFEDSDWSIRTRQAGLKIMYTPTARAWHKVSATSQPGNTRSAFQAYYHIRNHLLFLSRYSRITTGKHVEVFAMICYNLLKAAVGSQRAVSLARIQGILDYYRGRFGKTLQPAPVHKTPEP